MTKCLNCDKLYRPGNWKWSAWQCSQCTKAGVKPDMKMRFRLVGTTQSQ